MEEIIRMQNHLLLIRRTVGWTAEEFGEKIGVTRQTINNIEGGRNKLTKTQYIAMRSVLDAEIAIHPKETEMLKKILEVFVDNPESYKEEDREELLTKANLLAPSILAGVAPREVVSKEWMQTAGTIATITGASVGAASVAGTVGAIAAGPVGIVGGLVGAWLLKATSDKNNRSKK